MKPLQAQRPDIIHPANCQNPCCNPRRAALNRLLLRAPGLFASGMVTGAAIVAATGNLGAALRALFGL